MITKETARLVYNCYSEIENSNNMLEEMKKSINEKGEFLFEGTWGERDNGLKLSIPNKSPGSYSIRSIPPDLALQAIKRHIEGQNKELARLKTVCETQLI